MNRSATALVALAIAAALVAVLAASSNATSSPATANPGVESAVVSIVLTLLGLAILAILIGIVATFRIRRRGEEVWAGERAKRPWWQGLLALSCILAMLAGLGYLIFRGLHKRKEGFHPRAGATGKTVATKVGHTLAFSRAASGSTLAIVVLVVLAVVVYQIVRRHRGTRRLSDLSGLRRTTASHAPAATPPRVAPRGTALVDPSLERDPRRAILLAWLLFEAVLRRQGVGRHTGETAFEFADRVGATFTAPVSSLARRFVRARYSRLELGTDDRKAALDELARIEREARTGGEGA